jgi:hypothetical protein
MVIRKYGRFWAVYEADVLVCVCVYKRGAAEVVRRLTTLCKEVPMPRRRSTPDFSFSPIRARIAASLGDEAEALTTDVCITVAVVADGKHGLWLQTFEPVAAERDMLHELAECQDLYYDEIQEIRALTATLTAAGLALGFPADLVEQRIITKKRRELFELP